MLQNNNCVINWNASQMESITSVTRSGRTTPKDSSFSSTTPAPIPPEWPFEKEAGSGLTASARVSDVSSPACTNGAWPPLRPVSVAQKIKPSTMLSSNVQSIDLPMACMPWRSWTIDNRMTSQHLPWDLVRPSSSWTTRSKEDQSLHHIQIFSNLIMQQFTKIAGETF